MTALCGMYLLAKGCQGFLAMDWTIDVEVHVLELIPIVKEFQDVFPEELPGTPPNREIEFCTDLLPNT